MPLRYGGEDQKRIEAATLIWREPAAHRLLVANSVREALLRGVMYEP